MTANATDPNDMQNLTVLCLFAHPDDEAFGSGGTLAGLVRKGHNITLVCATNGDVGEGRGVVFVLRARDGAEVYRRYFRQYTRTRMAFLGPRHLAVTRADLDQGGGWIEVLQVPEAVAAP